MAAQTDLDRLQIAWLRLQIFVNATIPQATTKVLAARNRMAPRPPGPPPNQS